MSMTKQFLGTAAGKVTVGVLFVALVVSGYQLLAQADNGEEAAEPVAYEQEEYVIEPAAESVAVDSSSVEFGATVVEEYAEPEEPAAQDEQAPQGPEAESADVDEDAGVSVEDDEAESEQAAVTAEGDTGEMVEQSQSGDAQPGDDVSVAAELPGSEWVPVVPSSEGYSSTEPFYFETYVGSIKVTVSAEPGVLGDGTTVRVTPVYDDAKAGAIAAEAQGESKTVVQSTLIDVAILNADGIEIDPEPGTVVVEFASVDLQENQELFIHRFDEGSSQPSEVASGPVSSIVTTL